MMKRKILAALCIVVVVALALAATKSRYVQYQGKDFNGVTSQLFTPTYLGAAFVPTEMTIVLSGANPCSIAVYLCDTLTIAETTQAAATDSFYIPMSDIAVAGSSVFEYTGPMSGQMRFHATTGTSAIVHCFR